MKTYTATLVLKQYQKVRITVPNKYTVEQIEDEMCENADFSGGDFEIEVFDTQEVTE
jgi:hypothetical protein